VAQGLNDGLIPSCAAPQASVQEDSKHCKACERCVEGFDHHCKWLNNCIGRRNYRPFFSLLVSAILMMLLQVAIGLSLLARCFAAPARMRRLVHDRYGAAVDFTGYKAALGVYVAFVSIAGFLLGELFLFHVVLSFKGMSTYQYILSRREREQRSAEEPPPPPDAAAPVRKQQPCGSCRRGQVHDESLARGAARKSTTRVHINPCAAITTSMPKAKSRGLVLKAKQGGVADEGAQGSRGETIGTAQHGTAQHSTAQLYRPSSTSPEPAVPALVDADLAMQLSKDAGMSALVAENSSNAFAADNSPCQ
jgi:palmitoyltransferase ZDHHC1/11